MKPNKIAFLIFTFIAYFTNAQSIKFISEKTEQPLPKVTVFSKNGDIITTSDIDGFIEKSKLNPEQQNFQLVYDNIAIATLTYDEINKDVIKLNDRIKDIEQVVIKKGKPAKYIYVKGNFNAYVTLNGKLNCYADGIVTYVFDNETKKLKTKNIEQYRIYRLENASTNKKETNAWDYNNFLEIPQLRNVGNIAEFKSKSAKIKELKSAKKDEIEISGTALQEKEMALFGYRFFDITSLINHSYEKDSEKTIRDFLESNEVAYIKLKHKSEPNYNQVIVYKNFYPTELDYNNEGKIKEKVSFNKNFSNYSEKYWQDTSFPNMQTIFSSYFKDDLKERQNKK